MKPKVIIDIEKGMVWNIESNTDQLEIHIRDHDVKDFDEFPSIYRYEVNTLNNIEEINKKLEKYYEEYNAN